MDATLTRIHKLSTGIFSTMTVGDKTFCTGEHAYQAADGSWQPKIPPGVYTCQRRVSPHFGYDLFWVTNVPMCNWIEIHVGNYPQVDSEGCILMGTSFTLNAPVPMVGNSKIAFSEFMGLQSGQDTFQLTVVDA